MKKATFMFVSIIFSFFLHSSVHAEDGDVYSTTIKSEWALEGIVISVFYERDKQGAGSLRFVDVASNKEIRAKYLSDVDEDVIKDLHVFGMQSFNGLLIVTLETATSYLVDVFSYDENSKIVKQIISDGGRLQPELIYYEDSDHPAIGIPKLTNDSRSPNRIICGEKIYVFNKRENKLDRKREIQIHYRKKNAPTFSCED